MHQVERVATAMLAMDVVDRRDMVAADTELMVAASDRVHSCQVWHAHHVSVSIGAVYTCSGGFTSPPS